MTRLVYHKPQYHVLACTSSIAFCKSKATQTEQVQPLLQSVLPSEVVAAGAGKSWFAEAISKRRKVTIISQDESRSRNACENQLGASAKTSQLTILDR